MSTETKTALLIGLGIIIAFGVILCGVKGGSGFTVDKLDEKSDKFALDSPGEDIFPQVDRPREPRDRAVAPTSARRQPRRAAVSRTYTVKPNDSLTKIATKMYGRGNSKHYKRIFEANRNILSSVRTIRIGQVLVIPPLSEVRRADSSSSNALSRSTAGRGGGAG